MNESDICKSCFYMQNTLELKQITEDELRERFKEGSQWAMVDNEKVDRFTQFRREFKIYKQCAIDFGLIKE